jgi:hypothetical protein
MEAWSVSLIFSMNELLPVDVLMEKPWMPSSIGH